MAQPSIRQINEAFEAALKKDRLEASLRKEYIAWSNFVATEFSVAILNGNMSGKISSDSISMLRIILESHYKEAMQAFTNFNLNITKKQNNVVISTENKIKQNLLRLINTRLSTQTEQILDTTQNLMTLSIQSAMEGIQEEGIAINNSIFSRIVTNIFNVQMKGRATAISVTETTWSTEGARQINNRAVQEPLANTLQAQESLAIAGGNTNELALQASDLSKLSSAESAREAGILSLGIAAGTESMTKLSNSINNVLNMVKTWVTMGDAKVRSSHRAANGQTIPDVDPFQVGSSLLQYPADSTLGADISEIANCRCFVAYR